MKKKILSVMLVLSMLGLAACGAATATNETNSATKEESVEVSTAVMEDESKNPNQVNKDEAFANVYTEPETKVTTEETTEISTEVATESVTEPVVEEETIETATEEAYVAPDNYFKIMEMPMEDFLKYFAAIDPNSAAEIEVGYPKIELYFDSYEPDAMSSAVYCEFKDDAGNVKDIIRVVEYKDTDAAYKYIFNYREYAGNIMEKSEVAYKNSDGLMWYIGTSHPDVRPGMTEAAFLSNQRVVYYYTMKPYDAETIKNRIYELFKLEMKND